ncbi:MAG: LamG-like jellyroll fold domain-containing protein, partial [Planctomycetota bacterium]
GLYPWEPGISASWVEGRVVEMGNPDPLGNTDPEAKAGIMVREKMTPYSKYAAVGQAVERPSVTAPVYLRLDRTALGAFTASYSLDTWTWHDVNVTEDPDVTFKQVGMDDPCLHAGFAVTSHNAAELCTADVNNFVANPPDAGEWVWGNIGLNAAEQLYVALEDTVGNISVVEHNDVNAATLTSWQEWNVELTDFAVNLDAIKKVRIGLGDRDIQPAGGSGALYIDDVRACPPRCVWQYGKPIGDIAEPYDCIVDEKDLRVLAGAWLERDDIITTVAPPDANLVAHWPLDTDFLDYSGNNFHGDPNGGADLVSDADRGQVLRLYRDGDSVNCGNPTDPCALDFGTGNWTVSAWVKTTMLGTGGDPDKGVIYGKGGDTGGGHRYGLYVNEEQGDPQGRVNVVIDDNASDGIGSSYNKIQFTGDVVVSDGEWHHVVGLRDVNELRLYIDGLPDMPDGIEIIPEDYDLSGTHQHNAYIGAITNHTADPNGLHLPIPSLANVYNKEAQGSQWINLKDYSLITGSWLEEMLWPTE